MKVKELTKVAKAIGLSLLCLPAINASAAVFYSIPGTEYTLDQRLREQEKLLTNRIDIQKKQYVRNINSNTEKIVEALRVATAQEALSSMQISQADKNAKQVLTNAVLADMQAEAAMNAMLNYGGKTGQGYAACVVMAENSQLAEVMDTVAEQTKDKVDGVDTSPHVMLAKADDGLRRRETLHKQHFCTKAEEENDSCKAVSEEMQGADSNAATLFVSASKDSDIAIAKQAVRQNILGSPQIAIPKKAAGTATGQAYLYSVNHKTALSAFPAYSLAYLESMSEIRDDIKDADGNPQSPNDMLFNTVARYYGGKDSAEWQKSMISQQPRGLLVELNKMEGLGAWMDYEEILAMQRLEGNIAAMTLAAALPMEERLEKQLIRVKSQAVRDRLGRDKLK